MDEWCLLSSHLNHKYKWCLLCQHYTQFWTWNWAKNVVEIYHVAFFGGHSVYERITELECSECLLVSPPNKPVHRKLKSLKKNYTDLSNLINGNADHGAYSFREKQTRMGLYVPLFIPNWQYRLCIKIGKMHTVGRTVGWEIDWQLPGLSLPIFVVGLYHVASFSVHSVYISE